jgi:uncharacterized protein YhaN
MSGFALAAVWRTDVWTAPTQALFIAALVLLTSGSLGWGVLRSASRARLVRDRELEELEKQLGKVQGRMGEHARELGLGPKFAPADLDREEARVDGDRAAEARVQDRKLQAERIAAEITNLEQMIASLDDRQRHAVESHAALTSQWEAWRTGLGISEPLAPGDVSVFASGVQRAKDQLAVVAQTATDRVALREAIDDWAARASDVLEKTSELVPEKASDSLYDPLRVQQIVALVRRTREAQYREEKRPAVLDSQRMQNEKLAAAQQVATRADNALAMLFERVDAVDRDDYLVKLSHFRGRSDLEETIRDRQAELERRLGLGEEAQNFLEELKSGRVSEWELEIANADLTAQQLQETRDEILRDHQDARKGTQELETSNRVVTLELNRTALDQELSEVVSRWRKLQIARSLIERTLERFERERQPAVLKEASHYFSTVTAGRYPRIVQTAALGEFSVVDAAGERKTPDALSRGTAEQLYVCIRLGLIAEFSRRVGRLPVVMDDVLVNFDDDRALAMAQVLEQFSKRNHCQVLVFTCSSRTRELFATAAPTGAHFEIDAMAAPAT